MGRHGGRPLHLTDAVAGLPEIAGHLHAKPSFRGGTERLGQTNGHVDGHSGVLIDEVGEGLTRDAELVHSAAVSRTKD